MIVQGFFYEFDWYFFVINIYWTSVMTKIVFLTMNAGATTKDEVKKIPKKVHQIIRSVKDQETLRVVIYLMIF